MNKKEIGNFGEKVACYFLKKNGYRILQRNYVKEWSSLAKGEIDIIAKPRSSIFGALRGKKDDTIHFVEVKTIIQPAFGGLNYSPEDKVDFQKRKKIEKISQNWLAENKIALESNWQIDVISIKLSSDFKKAKIRHFENI